MKEKEGELVFLCRVDVITCISRLAANVKAKKAHRQTTTRSQKRTKTGFSRSAHTYSRAGLTQTHTPTCTDRPMTQ